MRSRRTALKKHATKRRERRPPRGKARLAEQGEDVLHLVESGTATMSIDCQLVIKFLFYSD